MKNKQTSDQLRVRDVMTREVFSVNPDMGIVEIADLMFKNRIHGVPVVEDGKVAGIVTETDFFTKDASVLFLPAYINFLKENPARKDLPPEKRDEINSLINAKARDIMTASCVTIFQDMRIKDLLAFFRTTNFISLPVTDENEKLVGIITLSDILGLLNV